MNKITDLNPLIKQLIYWALTILSINIISRFPSFNEVVYADSIYPVVAIVNRWFFRFLPFSAGDVIYIFGFSYLGYLLLQIIKNYRKPLKQFVRLSVFLLQVVWLFYLSWGFNYFREPLSKKLDLSEEKYSLEELSQVTDLMIHNANELQVKLAKNDSLAVEIPYSIDRIIRKVPEGYARIEKIIHQKYTVPCEKKSLISKQISYLGVSGYLNPFTGEAQINSAYPKIFLPDIASHEVAHQLGYAPENEANFLGYLSASNNPDLYFQYAAYIDALYYCLIELKKADKEIFSTKIKMINKGILANYKEAREFSETHQFPIDFSSTYDAYLKMNQQESGIQSYNEMVQLLIAYELRK